MHLSGDKTIGTYNNFREDFVSKTKSDITGVKAEWISATLDLIEQDDQILEIGTGPGRESDYFESLGYTVVRSDIIDGFIGHNRSNGKEIIKLDVLEFRLPQQYHMIFANAVLLHFNKSDFEKALSNILNTLTPLGFLSFSVKKGIGEGYIEEKLGGERYYKYRTDEHLEKVLISQGFSIHYIQETNFHGTDRIFVIAQKS